MFPIYPCDGSGSCRGCHENRNRGSNYKGHRGYRPPKIRRWEWSDMALLKRGDNGVSQCDTPLSVTGAFGKLYPDLVTFVSQSKWDDGSERTCGTILLLCEEGRAKVWLNDKDAGLSCWVSGDTMEAALASANKAVSTGGGDWRRPPLGAGKRR
jgi:hypothetical protein